MTSPQAPLASSQPAGLPCRPAPATPAEILDLFPTAAKRANLRAGQPLDLFVMHALVVERLLPVEALPAMGPVQVAPGWIVDASRLRWHPRLMEIVYLRLLAGGWPPQPEGDPDADLSSLSPSPEGGYVRIYPIARMLAGNGDATGWIVDQDDWNARRYSLELRDTIRVAHVVAAQNERLLRRPLREQQTPGDRFVVVAVEGGRELTDIDDAEFTPRFRSLREACRLADRAILCEPTLPDGWSPFVSSEPPRLRWVRPPPQRMVAYFR